MRPHADTTVDDDLVARSREGDTASFAELWRRHSDAGRRFAATVTSAFDADDLVAEAFARIFRALRNGNGPVRGFRAYLYTTIRNAAAAWGSARQEVAVEDPGEYRDEPWTDDHQDVVWERSRVAAALGALPERWRSALWYSEVEQLTSTEVAGVLGISPNAAAALTYRAREGLRRAWVAQLAA
ncbi:RNA polymerase sigma factor [Leifsonia sp. NPDC056824]|jgi:RNA polymerase sigma factor (sigma-70 family)|uniref:RNA polymerase sigma factor n=1 Tax=Leifsonia sp. NPDC056824 TaxID=3345953 RepID=UPI0036B920EE